LTFLEACTTAICANNFSGGNMIDMGTYTLCAGAHPDCPGITIEHLGLQGSAIAGLNGIFNSYAQELSYVSDVAFSSISGISLEITSNYAANSGPYSGLTMAGPGPCLEVVGGSPFITDIRGILGVTCTGSTASPAIYLEGSNNRLENISVVGTSTSSQDGILIGANAPAAQIALINIRGSGLLRLIHISGATNTDAYPPCPFYNGSGHSHNVCDVTVLGVSNSGGTSTDTIADDVTNTYLTDPAVGMYIVGEPVFQGAASSYSGVGTSRFTTSLNAPSWLVGTSAPGSSCATLGALYSQTTGGLGTSTLYACISGAWTVIK
jgi:hypothetical protein